jgi:site-specific DNA recombinase
LPGSGWDRVSLREVCRRLQQAGVVTRRGSTRWYASTLGGMLTNTTYIGRAIYGHARYISGPLKLLRPLRGHPDPCRRPSVRVKVPRQDWIEVPVPALVDPAVFEAAQMQLLGNRQRKRASWTGPRWLLQGLTVCRRCGYAYYGKTAPQSKRDPAKGVYCYYRCIGTDGHRFDNHAMCDNPQTRGDYLEQAAWDRVRALLEDPDWMPGEYHRRLTQTQNHTGSSDDVLQLERQIARLQRGIGRLIDSYAEGVIEPGEFQPRIAGLKARRARLEEQRRMAVEEARAERELTLVIGRLEEFAARVSDGLDELDFAGKQALIRTLVRRIEIDRNHVEVVFRVPPLMAEGSSPSDPHPDPETWHHCTSDSGTKWRVYYSFWAIRHSPQASSKFHLRH